MSVGVLTGFIIVTTAAPASSQYKRVGPVVFQTQTMGTWASLTVVTADSAGVADLAYESLVVLHRVDSLMSNWTDVSDVARINREASRKRVVVHPEVAEVLAFALQVGRESGGAFDITIEPLVRAWGFLGGTPRVPSQHDINAALELVGQDNLDFHHRDGTLKFTKDNVRIDLGGIAKGYGVDRVAQLLRRFGVADALVDLSGNMVALGNAAGRTGWTLGVRDPSGTHPYLARIVLENEAIATSADYEQFVDADGKRYGHIIDPRTGWSARGLASVTVVADQAMVADAWATALFVLGPKEARRIARERDDLSVILIAPTENGGYIAWVEEALGSRFSVVDDLDFTLTVKYF
jgi:thiamine biosynthesis lipoprotein